jgi:hypothetical protein
MSTWLIHGAIANERWNDLDLLLQDKANTGLDPEDNTSVLMEAFEALAQHAQWPRMAKLFDLLPQEYHERCLAVAWECAIAKDDPAVFHHFEFNHTSLYTADLANFNAKFMFLAAQTHIPGNLASTFSQKATAGWLLRLAASISVEQAKGMLHHLQQHHPDDIDTMRHMAWQQAIEKKDVRAMQNFLLAGVSTRDPDKLWSTLFSKPEIGLAVCENEEVKHLLHELVLKIKAVQPNSPFDGMWSLAPFQAMERAGLPVLDVRDQRGQSIVHAMLEYQSDPMPTLSWILLVRPELLMEIDQRGARPIDHISNRELTVQLEQMLKKSQALGEAQDIEGNTMAAPSTRRNKRL